MAETGVVELVEGNNEQAQLPELDQKMLDKMWRIHDTLDAGKSGDLSLDDTLSFFVMAGVTAQTILDLHRSKEQALRILKETDKVKLPLN